MLKDRIKSILKKEGLSQAKFAVSIKVSQSTVRNLVLGRVNLTDEIAIKIKKKYRRNFEWLKTGEGPEYIGADLTFQEMHNLTDEEIYGLARLLSDPIKKDGLFKLIL